MHVMYIYLSVHGFKNGLFEILVPYNIYTDTEIISLDETVINVRRNKSWQPFLKWPLNQYGNKK